MYEMVSDGVCILDGCVCTEDGNCKECPSKLEYDDDRKESEKYRKMLSQERSKRC